MKQQLYARSVIRGGGGSRNRGFPREATRAAGEFPEVEGLRCEGARRLIPEPPGGLQVPDQPTGRAVKTSLIA